MGAELFAGVPAGKGGDGRWVVRKGYWHVTGSLLVAPRLRHHGPATE